MFHLKYLFPQFQWHAYTDSAADWCKNCGIYGKGTKFGTEIGNYPVNNISYGSMRVLSHNCSYNGFKVAHSTFSMGMRLGELFAYFQQSGTTYMYHKNNIQYRSKVS